MGACGCGGGSSAAHGPLEPACALLVTGRRGPFPTYRLNGIYYSVEGSQASSSASSSDAKIADTVPERAVYVRVDRPEVSIVFDGDYGTEAVSTWQCELEGEVLARARPQTPKFEVCSGRLPLLVEVRESEGNFVIDPDVIVLGFPAPPPLPSSLGHWSRKRRKPWQQRQIAELACPRLMALGAVPGGGVARSVNTGSDAQASYRLWGAPGTADCLSDLLQGECGNCGVLAAVDALAHTDPFGCLGHLLRPSSDADGMVMSVQLFDPASLELCEWQLGAPCQPSSKAGVLPADPACLTVSTNLAVPRFARSLSSRCWGVLLEAALADIAGGHKQLGQCEPGAAWLALLGPSASVRRFQSWPNLRWQCWEPNLSRKSRERALQSAVRQQGDCGAVGTSLLPARKAAPQAGAWRSAGYWRYAKLTMDDAEFRLLLEASAEGGVPLCLYPVGFLRPSKEAGEPCVPLEVYFGSLPSRPGEEHPPGMPENAGKSKTSCDDAASARETTRFCLGHCYSIRAAASRPRPQALAEREVSSDGRDASKVHELWLQLRDPRRVRLYWVSWDAVMKAAENKVVVYSCNIISTEKLD